MIEQQFTQPLLYWFDQNGRKNLPWKEPVDPYRIWVSEIMLQQTQVQTVIDYFNRFIEHFPTVFKLAKASDDAVLALWSGLGYYSRARNLHRAAQMLVSDFNGIFPQDLELLKTLPGIGPSTAAAIMSQAFNLPYAILDGNVKRVLSRFFLIDGVPEQAQTQRILWEKAQLCMPQIRCNDYTQAIMDLGALCCTNKNPNCRACPLSPYCMAFKSKEQHNYPRKKIKKPIPIQRQLFLVMTNEQGSVYLEKKPPTGLWGGLWCLPSIDVDQCPQDYIQKQFSLNAENPKHLTSFKHKFSHFHLEIEAIHLQTTSNSTQIAESTGRWYAIAELSSIGMAKPTQVILSLLRHGCT